MIVVDSSALIEVLLRTPGGYTIEARLFRERDGLHAPHLIDAEIASVLRRLASRGDLDDRRGREILADLADMPVHRYPHGWLLGTAWRLRANVSAYDAMSVALADALGGAAADTGRPARAGRRRSCRGGAGVTRKRQMKVRVSKILIFQS